MNWLLVPLREGIITILIVAGPIILVAAAAGLLIGVLQAATQIQDQAIPNAVKLIGIMVLLIVLGAWMFSRISGFTEKTIGKAFSMVINNRTPVTEGPSDTIENKASSQFGRLQPPFKPFGQLSGNTGSFQAKVAPPMQAFSNALQTGKSPVSYYPVQPQQQYSAAPFNQPNYNSAPQSFSNYPQQQFNQQYPPAGVYSYNNSNSQTLANNRRSSDYMNNPYQQGYYPPNSSQQQPLPQQYPPQYNAATAYSQIPTNTELMLPQKGSTKSSPSQTAQAPKNKVILQSSNSSAQQSVKILKPKLPGMDSSEQISGDPLPPPASGTNWW